MSIKIASLYAEITADTTKLQAGLANTKSSLVSVKDVMSGVIGAAGLLTTAYYAASKALNATVGEYVKYANEVRTITQITGQEAEAVSRMIQLSDDYKITSDQLTLAMKKMATEGFALTTESLAAMSDEYLTLSAGVERQTYLTEKFGRQGIAFAEIMLAGGDAIRAQSDAISENLVLTDEALKQARAYEYAVDELNDTIYGLKIGIGSGLTPVLTNLLKVVEVDIAAFSSFGKLIEALGYLSAGMVDEYIAAMNEFRTEAGNAIKDINFIFGESEVAVDKFGQTAEDSIPEIQDFSSAVSGAAGSLQEAALSAIQAELALDGAFTAEDAQRALDYALALGLINEETYNARVQVLEFQAALDALPDYLSVDVKLNIISEYALGDVSDAAVAAAGRGTSATKTSIPGVSERAAGGYVHSRYAITGDSTSGRPTGYEELVDFDARRVYSAPQTRSMIPHLASGSDSAGLDLSDRSINRLAETISFKLQPFI